MGSSLCMLGLSHGDNGTTPHHSRYSLRDLMLSRTTSQTNKGSGIYSRSNSDLADKPICAGVYQKNRTEKFPIFSLKRCSTNTAHSTHTTRVFITVLLKNYSTHIEFYNYSVCFPVRINWSQFQLSEWFYRSKDSDLNLHPSTESGVISKKVVTR